MTTKTQTCPRCAEPPERHKPNDGCPYNGWRNYETWCVKLWMDNDEGSQQHWTDRAQSAWEYALPGVHEWQTREQQATYSLSKELKDYYEEMAWETLGNAGVLTDLLGAVLHEVFWEEIAQSLMEDVDKTGEDEGEE